MSKIKISEQPEFGVRSSEFGVRSSELELCKKLLGEEHPDVANSLNNLAYFYTFQGRYSEADPLLKQVLKLYKKLLGEEHSNTKTINQNYEWLKQQMK